MLFRIDQVSQFERRLSFNENIVWEIDVPPYPDEPWEVQASNQDIDSTFLNEEDLLNRLGAEDFAVRRDKVVLKDPVDEIQMGNSMEETPEGVWEVENPLFDYELVFHNKDKASNVFLSVPVLSYDGRDSMIAIWHLAIMQLNALQKEDIYIYPLRPVLMFDTLERYASEEEKAKKLANYLSRLDEIVPHKK